VTDGGFTLMELLVVLAVLGLALALAVPSLGRALPGLKLQTEVRTVAGALREARVLAIAGNRETKLVIDVQQRMLRLDGGAVIRLNPQLGISLRTASSETPAAGTGGISFFPDGTSTGGRVTLSLGERQRHVVVDWLTGKVSVVE
jgi:general secretion pathway protein H